MNGAVTKMEKCTSGHMCKRQPEQKACFGGLDLEGLQSTGRGSASTEQCFEWGKHFINGKPVFS